MDRAAPVRSSHTSTADLLAWPQPQGQGPAPATPSPPRRPGQVASTPRLRFPPHSSLHESLHLLRGLPLWIDPLGPCTQPSEAIRKVVFGGQVTEEEADSLTKRSDCFPRPPNPRSLAPRRAFVLVHGPLIRIRRFIHFG